MNLRNGLVAAAAIIIAWVLPAGCNLNSDPEMYTLTVSVENGPGCSVSPASGTEYEEGTVVTLKATSAAGYAFYGWIGPDGDSVESNKITMDDDKSITAAFNRLRYNLTVGTDPENAGTVNTAVIMDGGAVIPTDPSDGYNHQTVRLTAEPDEGYLFDHWSGDLTGTENPDTLLMDSAKTVTAHFSRITCILTVSVSPSGTGTVDVSAASPVDYGDSVTLDARPASGYRFDHWGGGLSGVDNPATIIMNSNTTVTAYFVPITYRLTLVSSPAWGGAILTDLPGEPQSSYDVIHDTEVQLTAQPANGYSFDHWTGSLSGTANPATVTMSSAKSVTAVFAADHPMGYEGNYSIGGVAFNMRYVQGGLTFPSEVPATITVADPYWIAETTVTWELWHKVYNWAITAVHSYTFDHTGENGGFAWRGNQDDINGSVRQPVARITWRDAMVWCNALTEYNNAANSTSYDCVYYTDAEFTVPIRSMNVSPLIDIMPGHQDNPYVKPGATGFRLPMSAEWELAARYQDGTNWTPGDHVSGDTTGYCYPQDGGTSTVWGDYSWHNGNTTPEQATQPVGLKLANALGLYDMSGNIVQLCFDWHPVWPNGKRIGRGGSAVYNPYYHCLGVLDRREPYMGNIDNGFRVVRSD